MTLFATVRPFRRAVRFQTHLIPILVRLQFHEWAHFDSPEEKLAARDNLDLEMAERAHALVTNMRGAYVKSAQLVTSLSPSPLRPAYVNRLQVGVRFLHIPTDGLKWMNVHHRVSLKPLLRTHACPIRAWWTVHQVANPSRRYSEPWWVTRGAVGGMTAAVLRVCFSNFMFPFRSAES